jgi:hypothetical protein
MRDYGGKQSKSFEIKFTDILYAAVISVSMTRLTLKFDIKEGLLLFAFLIIFDDWMDYHISTNFAIQTARLYFMGYILDILTLLTWYFITISLPNSVEVGLLFLVIFFLLALIWDVFMLELSTKEFLKSSYLYISIAYLMLLLMLQYLQLSDVQLLMIIFLIYIILKIPKWKDLYKKVLKLCADNRSVNI